MYYFRRLDVAYNGRIRMIEDGQGRVVASYKYDKDTGNLVRIRDMADNETLFSLQFQRSVSHGFTLKRRFQERNSTRFGLQIRFARQPYRDYGVDPGGQNPQYRRIAL